MKSLKRTIVEKLGKLNECGEGGGYYSSSSSSGSCGGGTTYSSEPSLKSQTSFARRKNGRSSSSSATIKNLTADIYGHATALQIQIDAIVKKSSQLGKKMPNEFKIAINELKIAAQKYQKLVDFYSGI